MQGNGTPFRYPQYKDLPSTGGSNSNAHFPSFFILQQTLFSLYDQLLEPTNQKKRRNAAIASSNDKDKRKHVMDACVCELSVVGERRTTIEDTGHRGQHFEGWADNSHSQAIN